MGILRKCGIKRTTLELGGKTPNIIFNDANIDYAVGLSTMTGFVNSG